ncbi:MAG: hypothetical protein R2911_43675 [Caldilineaceae bacterium]
MANYYHMDDTLLQSRLAIGHASGKRGCKFGGVRAAKKPGHDFAPEIAAAQAHQLLQAAYADEMQNNARNRSRSLL